MTVPGDRPRRALTLDLWHTLVYLEPDAEAAYMRAQVDLATRVLEAAPPVPGSSVQSSAELRRAFETVYAEAVAASQEGRSIGPPAQMVEAGRRAGRTPPIDSYLAELTHLVDRTRFLPAPGAADVLKGLRGDGWSLGLVSNTVGEPGASLRSVLNRLGFEGLIDQYVFSDEEPWTKPSPEIFEAALARLGAPASTAVHVGDGWPDIEGARRAGYRAGVLFTGLNRYAEPYRRLFLPADWSNPPTPYRFDRWPDLPGLLARVG